MSFSFTSFLPPRQGTSEEAGRGGNLSRTTATDPRPMGLTLPTVRAPFSELGEQCQELAWEPSRTEHRRLCVAMVGGT